MVKQPRLDQDIYRSFTKISNPEIAFLEKARGL